MTYTPVPMWDLGGSIRLWVILSIREALGLRC